LFLDSIEIENAFIKLWLTVRRAVDKFILNFSSYRLSYHVAPSGKKLLTVFIASPFGLEQLRVNLFGCYIFSPWHCERRVWLVIGWIDRRGYLRDCRGGQVLFVILDNFTKAVKKPAIVRSFP
jgi:hypothetical protein